MCLFQLWFPQGISPIVGFLGHMVVLFLAFSGISIPSSIVAVSIYIPTNSARRFPFFHTLSSIIVCRCFDDGHSNQCEVLFHCSFALHCSNNERYLASFHMFISDLYVIFGKNVHFGLLSPFWLGFLFFWYWAEWAACRFWRLIFCQLSCLLLFCSFWGLSFHLIYSFLHCAKA